VSGGEQGMCRTFTEASAGKRTSCAGDLLAFGTHCSRGGLSSVSPTSLGAKSGRRVRRGILRLRPDLSAQRGQKEPECRGSAQNDSIIIGAGSEERAEASSAPTWERSHT